jgi:hypothetical protein
MIKYFSFRSIRNDHHGHVVEIQQFNEHGDVGSAYRTILSPQHKDIGVAGISVLRELNYRIVTCIKRPNGMAYFVVEQTERSQSKYAEIMAMSSWSCN